MKVLIWLGARQGCGACREGLLRRNHWCEAGFALWIWWLYLCMNPAFHVCAGNVSCFVEFVAAC